MVSPMILFYIFITISPNTGMTVNRPQNDADVGIMLLQYAKGICETPAEFFSTKSFKKYDHKTLILNNVQFSLDESSSNSLRQEHSRLL